MVINAQTFSTYAGAAENQLVYKPIGLKNFVPLSQDEDIIIFTGVFHGQVVGGIKFAWLKDEQVVVNKNTRKIDRIYRCGNKGKFYPVQEPVIPLSQIKYIKGEKGDKGDPGTNGIDGRDFTPTPTIIIHSGWTGWNTGATILGGIVGGIVGGYVFRTTEEKTNVKEAPGVPLQTGNGTIIWGPNQIIITKEYHQRFNFGAAAGCSVVSAVAVYYLNKWLF